MALIGPEVEVGQCWVRKRDGAVVVVQYVGVSWVDVRNEATGRVSTPSIRSLIRDAVLLKSECRYSNDEWREWPGIEGMVLVCLTHGYPACGKAYLDITTTYPCSDGGRYGS